MPVSYGAVFHFPDDGLNPIYSYIKTSDDPDSPNLLPFITEIREEKAISNKANTGAYVFASASLLHTWAGRNIDSNAKVTEVGEYYTSQMIGTMIHDGNLPFLGLRLEKKDFSCVGTPEQLEELLMQSE